MNDCISSELVNQGLLLCSWGMLPHWQNPYILKMLFVDKMLFFLGKPNFKS